MGDGLDWLNTALNVGTYQNTNAAVELLERQYAMAAAAEARKQLEDKLVGLLSDAQSELIEQAHRGQYLQVLLGLFRFKTNAFRIRERVEGAQAKTLITDLQLKANGGIANLLSNPDVRARIQQTLVGVLEKLRSEGRTQLAYYQGLATSGFSLAQASAAVGPLERLALSAEMPGHLRDDAQLAGQHEGTVRTIYAASLERAALSENEVADLAAGFRGLSSQARGIVEKAQQQAERKADRKFAVKIFFEVLFKFFIGAGIILTGIEVMLALMFRQSLDVVVSHLPAIWIGAALMALGCTLGSDSKPGEVSGLGTLFFLPGAITILCVFAGTVIK